MHSTPHLVSDTFPSFGGRPWGGGLPYKYIFQPIYYIRNHLFPTNHPIPQPSPNHPPNHQGFPNRLSHQGFGFFTQAKLHANLRFVTLLETQGLWESRSRSARTRGLTRVFFLGRFGVGVGVGERIGGFPQKRFEGDR